LLANGFRVVTFDAPGHGVSEGRRSSIVHFAKALQAAVVSQGPAYAVIAHSLGAAATLRAITRGLAVERVVLLGPTRGPRDWAEQFRRQLGIPASVMEAMRERSERWLGARWEEFDVPEMARGQRAPMLLFHDRNDAEVPWSDGAAIASAWPGARLVTTVGLGHRRILRDERVVAEAVAFLKGEAGVGFGESYAAAWAGRCASPGCTNAPVEGVLCESCSLETSLYYRDSRQGASAA
jgi:pimeloyl-ACP methyl ester carboxylesterase